MTTIQRPTKAILDGDILAYRAAFWADTEGVDYLRERLEEDLRRWTPDGVDEVVVALSCPRKENFRRDFWPLYKEHRSDKPSPESLPHALDILRSLSNPFSYEDRLEADDLIGIMASSGEVIGVTIDKDLLQVPGWMWNPDKETEPTLITEEKADLAFYKQWMMGDTTDNVWGLWKVGEAKALKILMGTPRDKWDYHINFMYSVEDWDRRPDNRRPSMSKTEFCLSQARCVRILRNKDYNKKTQQVSLWQPQLPS